MAVAVTVASFADFAVLMLAAREGAADLAVRARALSGTPLARGMARRAEEIALGFTHPGGARDDAIAVFWQVAPLAFADPGLVAAGRDPDTIADGMVASIRASALAHDFRQAVLAEPLFRLLVRDALAVVAEAGR